MGWGGGGFGLTKMFNIFSHLLSIHYQMISMSICSLIAVSVLQSNLMGMLFMCFTHRFKKHRRGGGGGGGGEYFFETKLNCGGGKRKEKPLFLD